jgi:hypothetical protein
LQSRYDPKKLIWALLIQIPWVSTPLLLYRFGMGTFFGIALSGIYPELQFTQKLFVGSTAAFGTGVADSYSFGVNIVPVVMLAWIALNRDSTREVDRSVEDASRIAEQR